MEKQERKTLDLHTIFQRMKENKRRFFITLPITFVLSCLYIICIPRYYNTELKLVPESDNALSGTLGSLGSIASSFGVDLSDMQSSDAISPALYPDLMEDNGFVAKLFPIHVESSPYLDEDEEHISTTYFDYLFKHQKEPWWAKPINWVKKKLTFKKKSGAGSSDGKFNPYELTEDQDKVVQVMRNNVLINIDKTTGVISIDVEAQDPLICKTMADSIKDMLQTYITEYRTSKSKIDLKHYQQLEEEAKRDYEAARLKYSEFADAHTDLTMESFIVTRDDLENDMQLKYNTYSSLQTQVQLAHAKVQAQTPAFTVIKGAEVPIKPTGPKRMLFVLIMTFLAFTATLMYSVRKDMVKTLNS